MYHPLQVTRSDHSQSRILRGLLVTANSTVELPEPWCTSAVAVVLPTYNEAENLPLIVDELFRLPLSSLRVLVVDDNSPDGTGLVAEGLAQRYGSDRITVMHRSRKEGLGRAYVEGMSCALTLGAEFVVQMDSDLSHPPEYVPQMLGTLLSTDAAVVIGSRYITGGSLSQKWAWHRRLLSRWANTYIQMLLHMRISDVTAGYKMWHCSSLDAINLNTICSSGYSFQVEMNYRAMRQGMKIVEIPISFSERRSGASKMSFKVQLESALLPFRLKRLVLRENTAR
jgi:dolichol-phosphate mannosyltransferase